jgi:hypothetical protein
VNKDLFPAEILTQVYSFDPTYHLIFRNCIEELVSHFACLRKIVYCWLDYPHQPLLAQVFQTSRSVVQES